MRPSFLFHLRLGATRTLSLALATSLLLVATGINDSQPSASGVRPDSGLAYLLHRHTRTNAAGVEIDAGRKATSGLPTPRLQVVDNISVGSYPWGVAVDPANGLIYVTNFGSSSVSIVNPVSRAVVKTLPAPLEPGSLVVDTSTGNVYLGDGTNELYEISGVSNQFLPPIKLPLHTANADVYDPIDHLVYVSSITDNEVVAVSTETHSVSHLIPVGQCPNDETYDQRRGEVFVVNECSSNVSIINAASGVVVGSIPDIVPGVAMAYDPAQGCVYIAGNNRSGVNTLTCINDTTEQVQSRVPIPLDPLGVRFVSSLGTLYVASRMNSSITAIDAASGRVLDELTVQSNLTGIDWDAALRELFVADTGTGRLAVVQPFIPRFQVNFTERGLPANTTWSVSLNGVSNASADATIGFVESNGSYTFSVTNPPGWSGSPSGGLLLINGANVSTLVQFPAITGSIVGTVDPPTAGLWIDGVATLLSPNGSFAFLNHSVGVHSIVVRDSGYYPYYDNVSVQSGNTTTLHLRLTPIPPQPAEFLGGFAWTLIGALAIALVLVSCGIVILWHTARRRKFQS
jgi:YVTN family beta-propeller protein